MLKTIKANIRLEGSSHFLKGQFAVVIGIGQLEGILNVNNLVPLAKFSKNVVVALKKFKSNMLLGL